MRERTTLERITHLAIPPAWRSVAINRSARHRIQAVGRDKKDRWQYLYHPDYRARMERKKFKEMRQFARTLPHLRRLPGRTRRHPLPQRPRLRLTESPPP